MSGTDNVFLRAMCPKSVPDTNGTRIMSNVLWLNELRSTLLQHRSIDVRMENIEYTSETRGLGSSEIEIMLLIISRCAGVFLRNTLKPSVLSLKLNQVPFVPDTLSALRFQTPYLPSEQRQRVTVPAILHCGSECPFSRGGHGQRNPAHNRTSVCPRMDRSA